MSDTPRSKSYTVTFQDEAIDEFENLCTTVDMKPESLLLYALGAYKFIALATAQGSVLYLDDTEIILDTEDDDDDEEEEGVEMTVFRVIEGGRED